MINYFQTCQTTGEYYASEVPQLKEVIKVKHRGKVRAGVLLLQDNALWIQTAASCPIVSRTGSS
jgi:hypothetical protein